MRKLLLLVLFLTSSVNAQIKFAMFGDYGVDEPSELAVSILVKSWNPDFIVTTGDNNYFAYSNGDSIDFNIGKYYQEFIKPYIGNFGSGSPTVNRFFPTMGNHDFYDYLWYGPNDIRFSGHTYYNYFKLTDTAIRKGNTPDTWSPLGVRYYTFKKGNVQFFIVNSGADPHNHSAVLYSERDGVDSNSVQAQWIKNQMSISTATWKIVVLHHPPYSSVPFGQENYFSALRWNFKQWGASAVVSGHTHAYESLVINGLPFFVSGLGGEVKLGTIQPSYPGSRIQYIDNFGSMLCLAYNDSLIFKFITIGNQLIDQYKLAATRNDVGVNLVKVTDSAIIYTGASYCFNAQVKNFGSNDLNLIPVKYTINGGAPVGTVTTGLMYRGDSSNVSFCGSNSFIPPAAGNYILKFFTALSNDTIHSNDTTTLIINAVDSSKDVGVINADIGSTVVYTGLSVPLNAIVKNFGLANLPPFNVSYKVNNSSPVSTVTSNVLNSGATTNVLFNGGNSFTPTAAGIYSIKFYTSLNTDVNHLNDTATINVTVIDSSKDAGVITASTLSDTIYTGTNVFLNAVVKNFGLANLPPFNVSYKVNNSSPVSTVTSNVLNSGATTNVLFNGGNSFTPTAAGIYSIKFYTSLNTDVNHLNDTAFITVAVIDSSKDAGVLAAGTLQDTIYTGVNVSFNAFVKNFGQAFLATVPVHCKINNDTDNVILHYNDLNSGETASVLFSDNLSFDPTSAGNYTATFFTSVEGDENHNNDTISINFSVIDSTKDAGIIAAGTLQDTIYTGVNVSFNAFVKNFGLAFLATVPVHCKINNDTDNVILHYNDLNSGETASVLFCDNLSFVPTSAGNYTATFFTSVEDDENHNNDTISINFFVIDSTKDAGIIAAGTLQDTIYTGVNVSFNAFVKNFGLAYLTSVPVHYKIEDDTTELTLLTGAINSGESHSILFTDDQSFTPMTPGEYNLKFFTTLEGDVNHNNDTIILLISVIDSVSSTVSISIIPEGLYNSLNGKLNMKDSVRVYLRKGSPPFNIVDSSVSIIDSVTFEGSFTFFNIPNGSYYIVISHRNSIETWSSINTVMNRPIYSYNFTEDSTRAFGNNLIRVCNSPARFAIYSGDVNQDGWIDVTDLISVYNDGINYESGYVNTDIDGNQFVDVTDLIITYNNSINLVGKIIP